MNRTSYFGAQDGTQLFYRDWGNGDPVVFLAGWAVPSDFWGYQMFALKETGYRCIGYDRRGHGRSADCGGPYDFDTLAGDLNALLEHLDLHNVTLVGHSVGGAECVRYLTRHGSDRIARLVLVAAMTPMVGQAPTNPDGVPRDAIRVIRKAYTTNFPAWLRENAKPFFAPDTPEPMLTWLENLMLQTSLQAVIELYDAMAAEDFRDEMRAIRVPTLIVHGTKDMSIPIEISGYKTVDLVEGARLTVYEDSPHGLPLTHAARLSHDLIEFIGTPLRHECP